MVGADYIKLIWVPDTFFVNEKEARFHAATQVLLCFVVVFFSIFIFLFSLYFHIVDVVVVVVFQLFSTTGALVVITV